MLLQSRLALQMFAEQPSSASSILGETAVQEPVQRAKSGKRLKQSLGAHCELLSALKVKLHLLPLHIRAFLPSNQLLISQDQFSSFSTTTEVATVLNSKAPKFQLPQVLQSVFHYTYKFDNMDLEKAL